MEKPCLGALFLCDNDILFSLTETTGDTLDYHFHLIFYLLCSNTYQSSKTLKDSFCTGAHQYNSDAYDQYEGGECELCDGLVQFQFSCKNARNFFQLIQTPL